MTHISTFYGGEQIISVQNIDQAIAGGATVTLYTVPSGHYGKMSVFYLSDNLSMDIVLNASTYPLVPVSTGVDPNNVLTSKYEIDLLGGSAISVFNSVGAARRVVILVKVYKNP